MNPAPSIPPSPFFHTVEKSQKNFPYRGKITEFFSILWKISRKFFHTVEKSPKFFPYCGKFPKKSSILWKTSLFFLPICAQLINSAQASPFTVTAALDTFQQQPALRVSFDFPPDHHLYESFTVADPQGTPLQPLYRPAPDPQKPDDFEPAYSRPFSAFYPPPSAPSITVSYQGCKGTLCFMPETVTLPLAPSPPPSSIQPDPLPSSPALPTLPPNPRRLSGYADVPAFLAFLDPSANPPASPSSWKLFLADPSQFYLRHGILPSLLLILLGGFLLNLTPCVLPMIPINLAIIGASGTGASQRTRFTLGLVYGLGMALVYGALGLLVILTGSVFGAINASPVFNGAIALLFGALALAMFDVWQLDFSRFRKTSPLAGRARLPAILLMGGLSALLAGACVAPVLIAVLALSSSLYAQGVTLALALPFVLGLGMALPWPLAAAGLAVLPKPGAWMDKIKKTFGVLILLLALYYAHNTLAAFRSPPPVAAPSNAPPAASPFRRFDFSTDSPEAFPALLAEAAASGKPVLLDFGAHWCKSCKLMDATTLRDPAVVAKLQDVFPIQILADHPGQDPARTLLAPFAIPGYPTFLLYPAP